MSIDPATEPKHNHPCCFAEIQIPTQPKDAPSGSTHETHRVIRFYGESGRVSVLMCRAVDRQILPLVGTLDDPSFAWTPDEAERFANRIIAAARYARATGKEKP